MQIVPFQYFDKTTITVININGEPWFILQEICRILRHTNPNRAKNQHCAEKGITLRSIPTKGGNQKVTLINESNLYRLIFSSKLDGAKKFQDWIMDEVLPSIRKTGGYDIYYNRFNKHLKENHQKDNSKSVNSKNYQAGGVGQIIEYNRRNCITHSGLQPHEVKKIGKNRGLKSKDIQSAKSVLRIMAPEVACAMSFADSLVAQGRSLDDVSPASKAAIKVFEELLKLKDIKMFELDEE